jgi:hypothetical protein
MWYIINLEMKSFAFNIMNKILFVLLLLFLKSMEKLENPLIKEIEFRFKNTKETEYVSKNFEDKDFIYKYDCCGFVSSLIKKIDKNSYKIIKKETNLIYYESKKGCVPSPVAFRYFFQSLNYKNFKNWQPLQTNLPAQDHNIVESIKPGDILAWVSNNYESSERGHVCIVLESPKKKDFLPENWFSLKIADSTNSPHSNHVWFNKENDIKKSGHG